SVCACYFFFQAEDGIRDFHVTGVQTCALPIFREIMVKYGGDEINEYFELLSKKGPLEAPGKKTIKPVFFGRLAGTEKYNYLNLRSEERRVGKECRSRWWRYR